MYIDDHQLIINGDAICQDFDTGRKITDDRNKHPLHYFCLSFSHFHKNV